MGMDFKAEIQRHTQNTQAKTDEALQDIHHLNATILALNDKNQILQEDIAELNAQYAPLIKELNEKKSVIAQWEQALTEHKIRLKTNEKLYKMQAEIKKNQKEIQSHLITLESQKEQLYEKIRKFYAEHYINSTFEDRLKQQLQEQQDELQSVINSIEQLEEIEQKLNFIIKAFLSLFRSWGWTSDPLADEQKKLSTLSNAIAETSETLKQYNTDVEELSNLRSQEQQIALEHEDLLSKQEAIQYIDDIQKSIQETKQTIHSLNEKIKNTHQECTALQKKINNKTLERKNNEQASLLQDLANKKILLQEKHLALAEVSNPTRTQLKTQLVTTLLEIIGNQEQATNRKYELSKTSHFFKPTAEDAGVNSVPHHIALMKIQDAIRKFQKGLESGSQENRVLSQISAKILLWQMSESNVHDKSFSSRQNAHQIVCTELAALIGKLPFDNPLHASLHYIESLTTPIEIKAQPELTNRGINKR